MTTLADLGGWPAVLQQLISGRDLPAGTARAAMDEILDGQATPAQFGAFVVALRMKGESVDELNGMLDSMLAAAHLVPLPAALAERAVDVVGTGGDRSHSINVSTLAALVAAGGGVPVCKHGNRAASSRCGAADLLEALGVAIELSPAGVARCVEEIGIGFCLAPRFHPALRHAGPARREMGVPTAFNFLGPLANPARVRRMLLGVADPSMAERMLAVLEAHGAEHVVLVHGHDGLDELTTTGPSTAWELRAGEVSTFVIDPAELGVPRADAADLRGGTPDINAERAIQVLAGERGAHRDIVVLNAGAALMVGAAVPTLEEGMALAAQVLDDGRAMNALDRLRDCSLAAAEADLPG
ncbi:MAG TPA: anthranilate phosphoribosyltransferase [Acidimicrobiales bacterium]|nr:anthranilate phosphoribosyltransferase [Acidimicrobiales bacterium]